MAVISSKYYLRFKYPQKYRRLYIGPFCLRFDAIDHSMNFGPLDSDILEAANDPPHSITLTPTLHASIHLLNPEDVWTVVISREKIQKHREESG